MPDPSVSHNGGRTEPSKVRHAPMPERHPVWTWQWLPACSCGWKIRDGSWTRKSAEERSLIHAERARVGLPA